ncbi:MAG TPA: TonB-dependent receptor [Flavitalea sp.]|nr:TonB-dependent receptor [Flavitalea sp.]
MKKRLLLAICFCMAFAFLRAQDITVNGKVTDNINAQPLSGVTVSVKGKPNQSVVTNDEGNFTLNVSGNGVLVFSYVGYNRKEVGVGGKTELSVVLELSEADNMQEVVVVGAVIKKRNLTGAISSINADRISETPTTSINQAIQGKLPGARITSNPQPGADAGIKIRGNNSIQFGTNPIFVVDGVIIDGGFNSINPDDIASLDVLKDASATAIYGSRGANGVVVVTTKKGRKGSGNISLNSWMGWQKFSKKMDLMNANDIYDLRVDAFANQYMENNPSGNRQDYIDRFLTSDTSIAFAGYERDAHAQGRSYDWLDAVQQTGVQQNHTLSFSGGTDKGDYFLSLNYTDQKGLIQTSGYKRYGGRINIDHNVKDWLRIGTSTSFTRTDESVADGSIFSAAVTANPLLPVDTTGLYYLKWADILNQDSYNPLRSLYIQIDNHQNRIISSNYININPIKDLNIRSTFSLDYLDQQKYQYIPSITGQDQRNSNRGAATQYKNENTNWQWDNTITYNKKFGRHNINGLVGTSTQQQVSNYNQVNAFGFPNDDFSYRYLGGAFSRDKIVLASDFVTTTMMSFIGRADYSFDDKYFATATFRYDGSSRFGEKNKWGAFPSLALSWDVSKEKFMSSLFWINRLKLRAGYGIAGNQNIPNYAYESLYRPNYTNNSVTYVSDGRLGNPDLRWEAQKQLDIGLDLAFINNRLNISLDYFDITNDDLLMVRTLSTTTGFTNTVSNVGALKNRGVEANISYGIIRTTDLQWNFNAAFSSDKNKITRLYGNTTAIYNKGGFTGVEIQRTGNLILGESLNSVYSYKFDKIAQEADIAKLADYDFGGRVVKPGDIVPVDKDGNGRIDDNDRYVVGKLDPKFYGGFGTDITYKGIGLNVFFNYSYGLKRISGFYEGMLSSSGLSAGHKDLLNRWTPQNTNTNVPRAVYGIARYGMGDVDLALQDASFLRLSYITLSYNLPQKTASAMRFTNARIYVSGNNLLIFTKDKGYDPETGDGYPNASQLTVGLNLSL